MSNSLIHEKSPYLLQHAENPVNWLPWCEEAFDRAHRENKPVFLSIGYSTCHWCHVMEKESFENQAVADILNKHFISVKVDREERSDVDAVYMEVCTTLNRSGGWPLTVIMTPDKKPFFAGTYLPRENRGNRLGLMGLLNNVAEKWHKDRRALIKAAEEITSFVNSAPRAAGGALPESLPEKAAEQFSASFDAEYGGFGSTPKFPSAHNLLFLLRYAKLSGKQELRKMVESTLQQMYKGGIYDHFGGGFSRYSTDREWLVPHFEKTLYDNALLALAYTEAWQDGHFALYRQVAESTLDYCLRELWSEDDGFYCAQDADSEGTEGAYYVFSPEEIKGVLGEDAGRHFCECYDITAEGNFEGKSIPNLLLNNRWNFVPEGYADYREKLRLYREKRLPLHKDRKILTSWNGLMLMALSRAAWAFSDARYKNAADRLADFLREKMGSADKLRRCFYDEAVIDAQLDDYAFYALGLLEHYRLSYDPADISLALELSEQITGRFSCESGGFYSSAADSEKLIKRPMEFFDGAMPSGNSAVALLFDLNFRLTGDIRWREERDRLLAFIAANAGDYPAGCAFALNAVLSDIYPTRELVCVSVNEAAPTMLGAITAKYAPELTVLLKTPQNGEALAELAPFTKDIKAHEGKNSFYVCTGGVCSLPFTE